MRKYSFSAAIVVVGLLLSQAAWAVPIAGVDFGDGSGGFDATPDDLNSFDSITVSDWTFTEGGGISNDANSQIGRTSAPVGKFNGENGGAFVMAGDPPPTLNTHSFSITIPSGVSVDLTNVKFDYSAATPGANQRWLAFKTSLDTNLLFSQIGPAREALDSQDILLSGAQYENLTNQTIDFQWYAGGEGSGDIDIDSILIEGDGVPFFEGPQLTVDRDTGSLTLTSEVDTEIYGYSILSPAGTLNQTGWTTISGNYDAPPSGDGSADSDDQWNVLTAAGVTTDLSESQLSGSGPFDGGMLTAGSPIVLSSGGAWSQFHSEDVTMLLLREDRQETVPVKFVGNGDMPFALGDFNFDGAIDGADHALFAAGLHTDLSDLTVLKAYTSGDMNEDLANNFDDLVLFRTIYDNIHGPGAFAAASAVPEPATWGLLLFAGVLLVRQRRTLGRFSVSSCKLLLIVSCVAGLFSANPANAQLLSVTNNDSLDPVDVYELSLGDLANGELVNIDRTHEFANLPVFLMGLDYVLTANDDKAAPAPFSVDVTFEPDTTLFLSIDGRVGDDDGSDGPVLGDGIMDWVLNDNWIDTGFTWNKANEDADTFRNFVYRLDPAGTSYTFLEQDNGGGRNAYSIAGGVVGDLAPTLRVDPDNGQVEIFNGTAGSLEFNYYEISSATDSLDGTGWNSLDNQGIGFGPNAGESWTEAGGSDGGILSEFFTLGSTAIDADQTMSLGKAFTAAGTQDVEFRFGLAGSDALLAGLISYEEIDPPTGDIAGDYNANGLVEQGDLDLVLLNWGKTWPPAIDGWVNGQPEDGQIDQNDLDGVLLNWGNSAAASTAAVPEPSTWALLLVTCGGIGLSVRKRRKGVSVVRGHVETKRFAGMFAMLSLVCLSAVAQAGVTNDREYWFGEDSLEGASQGAIIGSNNSGGVPAGRSVDSIGPSGAFLDLAKSGNPTYQNVGPSGGGLARPGALAGEFGARFSGTDQTLTAVPLFRPDEMAGPTAVGNGPLVTPYPFNYDNITARGLQLWVYPDAAAIGSADVPTTYQSIVADTERGGGPAIDELGRWTQSNGGHPAASAIPATVGVAGDQWYHVMHHISPRTAANTYRSVLYVNGVAVSANDDTMTAGTDGDLVGKLAVGAAEIAGDGVSPSYGNFFTGVVDDLEMYVFGNNTADGGQNYGTFDLFADNAWIVNEIATTIPGGVLQVGDLNKDGAVSGDGSGDAGSDDVSAFIAGWLSQNILQGAHGDVPAGDWLTWEQGDLNHDGTTDLIDALTLNGALRNAGLGGLDFSRLQGGIVPEPASGVLLLLAAAAMGCLRRR